MPQAYSLMLYENFLSPAHAWLTVAQLTMIETQDRVISKVLSGEIERWMYRCTYLRRPARSVLHEHADDCGVMLADSLPELYQ